MYLRSYRKEDVKALMELFHYTVHTINKKDYTEAQLNVWAPGIEKMNEEAWQASLSEHESKVAVIKMPDSGTEKIVGFADMASDGYLDRLYVSSDFQRRGAAALLTEALESFAWSKGLTQVTTYASITARPFFERRGYLTVRENIVKRESQELKNYFMVKRLDNGQPVISIRKMDDCSSDYALLLSMAENEDVRRRYAFTDKEPTKEAIKEKYRTRVLGQCAVEPLIIEINGQPSGYGQYYPTDSAGREIETVKTERWEFWGIDLCIGRPQLWGRGFGQAIIRRLARILFEDKGAAAVFLTPEADHLRACACYESAGFQFVYEYIENGKKYRLMKKERNISQTD